MTKSSNRSGARQKPGWGPGLAIGGSVLLAIAIGLGVRFWPQSTATTNHSGYQPRLAEVNGLPVPAISTQSPVQAPTVARAPFPIIITTIADGRYSLFNDAVQAHLQSTAQTSEGMGVSMSVSNIYLTANHLFISVCFSTPGPESRMIGPATLTYANGDSASFSVHPTLDQKPSGEDAFFHDCDTLEFQNLPVGAELSHLELSVQSVTFSATAPEGQTCPLTDARLASSLMLRKMGIAARCAEQPGESSLQIVSKPASMTDEEALNLAGRESAGMILGPWNFDSIPLTVD